MLQAHQVEHAAQPAAEHAAKAFNAGETIIAHVANSSLDHPLIHIPKIVGIDFSITKHVFMLWLVAAVVFVVVTWTVRRFIKREREQPVPQGFGNALEAVVEFVRDAIAQPNVGHKWLRAWTPLLLTLFTFIFAANVVGLIHSTPQ